MTLKMLGCARGLHVVAGLYNLAFIYTALHDLEHAFEIVQFISTPLLVLTAIIIVRVRKQAKNT